MSRKHHWSNGVGVYEGLYAFRCKRCGAEMLSSEGEPSRVEMSDARLPWDCDAAVLTVIHEDYLDSSNISPWDESEKHEWGDPPE